jgi:hypothetical protein
LHISDGPEIGPGVAGTISIVTRTLSMAMCDALSVTVTIYQVFTIGEATGFDILEVNPAGLEAQEYVYGGAPTFTMT